jgi:uncharacterized protein YlxW (UPF0749 family)
VKEGEITVSPAVNAVLERYLDDVTQNEYQSGSRNRDEPSTRRFLFGATVLMGVVLLALVTVAAVIAARSVDEERQSARSALIERIGEATDGTEAVRATLADMTDRVDTLRVELLTDEGSADRAMQIATLSAVAGTTSLTGPGLTVVIDDAPGAEPGSLNRVLDRDLQEIVNALWRMGASGIAINEERLTSQSAIRGAGEAVLVNYRPLTRPYSVEALGTTSTASEASELTTLLDVLQEDYGLTSQVDVGDVTLTAGDVHESEYAVLDRPGPDNGQSDAVGGTQ